MSHERQSLYKKIETSSNRNEITYNLDDLKTPYKTTRNVETPHNRMKQLTTKQSPNRNTLATKVLENDVFVSKYATAFGKMIVAPGRRRKRALAPPADVYVAGSAFDVHTSAVLLDTHLALGTEAAVFRSLRQPSLDVVVLALKAPINLAAHAVMELARTGSTQPELAFGALEQFPVLVLPRLPVDHRTVGGDAVSEFCAVCLHKRPYCGIEYLVDVYRKVSQIAYCHIL